MSLTLHDAIVAKLRERFKALKLDVHVEAHEGDVTPATFKRWLQRAPGVYVVCLGAPKVGRIGTAPHPHWRFAAFILARSTPCEAGEVDTGPRGRVAQALATRILAIVHDEAWGVGAQAPEDVDVANRSTPALAAQNGANLWVVRWKQQLALSPEELEASDRYIRAPRPLEGVDTRINPGAPPPTGETPLVTDSVSFEAS